MKSLIILCSYHHKNTEKVAKVMAEVLNAEIKTPQQINPEEIKKYDLIGFGSGIYNQQHHQNLLNLVNNIPIQNNKKTFIFSTNTFGVLAHHKNLKQKLTEKGFDVVGEFSCPGFINFSFVKYFFGGINKDRPNIDDLENAKQFVQKYENK